MGDGGEEEVEGGYGMRSGLESLGEGEGGCEREMEGENGWRGGGPLSRCSSRLSDQSG